MILKIISSILIIAYPILVFIGLKYFSIQNTSIILFIAYICLFISEKFLKQEILPSKLVLFILVLLTISLSYLLKNEFYIKLTPIITSFNYLIIFSIGLIRPPTIIEKIASIHQPVMTQEIINYCKKVTKIWCAYFIINIAIATWTIFLSMELWVLYNGFISYILMGSLMLSEYIYRRLHINKKSNLNIENESALHDQ